MIPSRVACPRLRGHGIVRRWASTHAHEDVGMPTGNVASERNSGCTKPNRKGATCGRDHERLAGGHRFRHRRSGGTLGLGATAPSRPSRAQPRRVPDDRIPRPPPRRSRTPGPDRPHRPRPHRRARGIGRPAPRRVACRYRCPEDPRRQDRLVSVLPRRHHARLRARRPCHHGAGRRAGAMEVPRRLRDADLLAGDLPARRGGERGRRGDDRGRCARGCALDRGAARRSRAERGSARAARRRADGRMPGGPDRGPGRRRTRGAAPPGRSTRSPSPRSS